MKPAPEADTDGTIFPRYQMPRLDRTRREDFQYSSEMLVKNGMAGSKALVDFVHSVLQLSHSVLKPSPLFELPKNLETQVLKYFLTQKQFTDFNLDSLRSKISESQIDFNFMWDV